jgi:hypothetical protein
MGKHWPQRGHSGGAGCRPPFFCTLSAEAAAILAGIAGYVLGSARAERNGNRTNNHEDSGEKREI